jgi:hypothetical protein
VLREISTALRNTPQLTPFFDRKSNKRFMVRGVHSPS